MSRWFRWYEGTCEDGKFRVTAHNAGVTVRDVIALWSFILEDAANIKHRGICVRNEDFMAAVLDFEDGEVEKILGAMEDAGLISMGHGAISVCNWGKRQYETDPVDPTNAERQKRFRAKQVKNSNVTEKITGSNGNVTAGKLPDTESESDTEKKEDKKEIAEPKKNGSARGHRLPPDWRPNENHYREAVDLHRRDRAWVDGCSTDMRIWADTNAHRAVARKLDWDLTFVGWMRREAQKKGNRNGSFQDRADKSAIAALDRLGDAFAAHGLREEDGQGTLIELSPRRLR